jgi:uncharacterized membrane protein
MNLLIRVLQILLAIAIVVACYFVTIWVLGLLGIVVPDKILRVAFVIIGLIAAIGVLSGSMSTWFRIPGPPG